MQKILLSFRVKPGSGRNRIVEIMQDGTIKVQIKAPPIRGKANNELLSWLAKVLDIEKNRIAIETGETSPRKRVSFAGFSGPEEIVSRLTADSTRGGVNT